ncbi:MAG: sugar phosphate isomerase/epimerase [Gemmatimonadaceae bacterium]
MTRHVTSEELDRRAFVKSLAGVAGAIVVGGCASSAMPSTSVAAGATVPAPSPWRDRMGLELYTVRDQIEKDFEGTLAQVAAAGYREVETTSYAGRTPAQVRAALDRAGLTSPATHVSLTPGPDLERQLAGYQLIGHRYSSARTAGGPGRGGPGAGRPPAAPGAPPAATDAPPSPPPPQRSPMDRFKAEADLYNQIGRAAKPYGVKVLIHNHTMEFQPFADSTMTPFDLLFAHTDPDVVAFELDLGWATVAGQNPLTLFTQHPHRFPLWHVKDMANLAAVTALPTQAERQRAAKIVPVGLGEISYRPIFDHAADAGLEHYFVEQDTAPQTGSLEAMRLSAQNLRRVLG